MGVIKAEITAQIKFSTQIIKRLGEELNPSIDQSILELVKNAYDADAKSCIVELESIKEEGGIIRIIDTGDGMDSDKIKNGWLILGESTKAKTEKTRLNRVPAGSKGLGRLAALRMGKVALLQSIPRGDERTIYSVKIDWEKYDNAKLVDEVNLVIHRAKSENKVESGTTITIEGLRTKIGEREVKKIARGLILLADPFEDDPNAFKPILKSHEFKELERLVARRYFDEADFHLIATVDEKGIASAKIKDFKGKVLFSATHEDIAIKRKSIPYRCPKTSFNFWAFILSETTFSTRNTALGEVKAWLKEFGGIHLYENGLRVSPYGNPGNDWLDINLSRARNPEERPSTNTSIGVVRVLDSDGVLAQKTDRSGYIESDSFDEIRQFCKDSLEWLAARRMEMADVRRNAEKQKVSKEVDSTELSVEKVIKLLPPAKRKKVEKAFNDFKKAKESEINSLKEEIQLYRTLSTAGITAATFSHESRGNSLKALSFSLKAIEKRAKENFSRRFEELFAKPILEMRASIDSLSVLGNATLSLLNRDKRRYTKVEIHKVIQNSINILKPFSDGRGIKIQPKLLNGKPYLRASEAAIESIVTNLLNNSIVALESINKNRLIVISTETVDSLLILKVSDNGPGIKGISIKNIWLPGQTSYSNGTGLGLTIVRDAVLDLGGNVSAIANGEYGGAEIIVEIPILGL